MFRKGLLSGLFVAVAASLLGAVASPSFAVQRTVTIYQIQDTTTVGHVVEGSTDTVTTSGILTGADTRPTGFALYIQDPAGGNYSGVQVFTGGANTFVDSVYARGDVIQATGKCLEFGGQTEIKGRGTDSGFTTIPTTTKLGTAAIPAPLSVTFSQLNELAAYNVGEKYEGVLLALSGSGRTARYPIYANGVSSSFPTNQYLIVDNSVVNPQDSVRVDGQTLAFPSVAAPAIGVVVSSVKGIGYQTALGYGIQLRDDADIVQPSPATLLAAYATSNTNIHVTFDRNLDPTTSQQVGNYSRSITLKQIDSATLAGDNNSVDLATAVQPQTPGESEQITISGVKTALGVVLPAPVSRNFIAGITPIRSIETYLATSPAHPAPGDTSQYINQEVTTRGVITGVNPPSTYYYQSGNAINPSSGMILFAPLQALDQADDVTIAGVVTEFGTASQATEFSGADYQFLNGSGAALPAAVVATPTQIGPIVGNKPYPGEAYEGMLVELDDVYVLQDSLPNGQYLVHGVSSLSNSDTVRVDDTMYHHIFKAYTHLAKLVGTVNDAFGQFVINPRSAADVDSVGVTTGVGDVAVGTEFGIRSITPTPVSFSKGTATMHFALPAAGRITARVYDVAGRLLAEPARDKSMPAGLNALAIDPSTFGRRGSGIFFVELQFGNRVATGKLVVTE